MNWDYNPWGYERYEEGTEYQSKLCSPLLLRLAQDVPFGKAQDEKKGEVEGDGTEQKCNSRFKTIQKSVQISVISGLKQSKNPCKFV